MATTFSNISQVFPTERGPVFALFTGEAFNLSFRLVDEADTPISLTGQAISITGDWYMATVGDAAIEDQATKIPGSPVTTLTFTPNSDQTANPGWASVRIPSDLYDDSETWASEIEINETRRPFLACYVTRNVGSGSEIRKSVFGISFRRGSPSVGPAV